MTDYDDYYDAAKKDGEPVIQGEHGGCIFRYLDGEVIRNHGGILIVWDAYSQSECRVHLDTRAEGASVRVGSIFNSRR